MNGLVQKASLPLQAHITFIVPCLKPWGQMFQNPDCSGLVENLTHGIYCSYYITPQARQHSVIKHIYTEKGVDNHIKWNRMGL